MRIASIVLLAACGSSGTSNPSTDAPSGGDSQRVIECAGTVASGQPSACPHGDCNEASTSDVVKCTAYASWVPGSMQNVCNSGQTGSFGVLFAKAPGQLGSYFYEVVECNGGTPTLHACTSGFTTDPNGYNGQPGFICAH